MTTYPLQPRPEGMQELGQAALDWVTTLVEGLAPAPPDGRNTGPPHATDHTTLRPALAA